MDRDGRAFWKQGRNHKGAGRDDRRENFIFTPPLNMRGSINATLKIIICFSGIIVSSISVRPLLFEQVQLPCSHCTAPYLRHQTFPSDVRPLLHKPSASADFLLQMVSDLGSDRKSYLYIQLASVLLFSLNFRALQKAQPATWQSLKLFTRSKYDQRTTPLKSYLIS